MIKFIGNKTPIAVPHNPEFWGTKTGDIPSGDYTEVEADGTIISKGDATVWDDLSTALIGRNLYTVVGRLDYNYDELTVDFSPTARYPEEPIGVVTQLLHARKTDSDIYPHLHWIQNSDNTPNILVSYRWQNNGEIATGWTLKALLGSDNIFAYIGVGMMQITPFNLPAGLGVGKNLSSTFEAKIYRDSANASGLFAGADTYAGDWQLKYYDIHLERDMFGSRQEFIK